MGKWQKWSDQEKYLLLHLVNVYGNNFHLFVAYFPGRTRDKIKSQGKFLMKKLSKGIKIKQEEEELK